MNYKYDNFVKELSEKIDNAVSEISAEYNFDIGNEFELIIAKLLKMFLPIRYGVCRGFIVTSQGEKAGDDIIIYDQVRFPRLRIGLDENFEQKQKIPVEAVYAYIEVKNSLELEFSETDESTLGKAIEQCKKAKSLVKTRDIVPIGSIDPYLNSNLPVNVLQTYPHYKNPPFAAIIAKEIRISGKQTTDQDLIKDAFNKLNLNDSSKEMPDLIIASKSNIMLWSTEHESIQKYIYYLLEHKPCIMHIQEFNRIALGAGFLNLLGAIDWMKLGKLPWTETLNNTLKKPGHNNG